MNVLGSTGFVWRRWAASLLVIGVAASWLSIAHNVSAQDPQTSPPVTQQQPDADQPQTPPEPIESEQTPADATPEQAPQGAPRRR